MRSLTLSTLFLVVVSAHAAPIYVDEAQRMAGTWRLVSVVYEDANKEARDTAPVENASGYQIVTPDGWWMTLITNDPRRAATGDAGAAVSGPLIAFAGKYRLERGRVLIKVEAERASGVIEMDLVSPYRIETGRLRMEFPQSLLTTAAGRSARAVVTWEREK